MELWKEELYHFGIQGMHWGIRRFQPYPKGHTGGKEVGEAAKKKRKRGEVTIQPVKPKPAIQVHEDYAKAHERKDVRTMSDAELRSVLNRYDMEKRYSQINPSAAKKGQEFVSKAIKVGTTVATITTTAINIYNNIDKITGIAKKMTGGS